MPRKKPWEYSNYRATLRRNGEFFAFVTSDAIGNNIGAKHADILMRALRSEKELADCCEELARRTSGTTDGRNWKRNRWEQNRTQYADAMLTERAKGGSK